VFLVIAIPERETEAFLRVKVNFPDPMDGDTTTLFLLRAIEIRQSCDQVFSFPATAGLKVIAEENTRIAPRREFGRFLFFSRTRLEVN
jgi:hypothetical protein